VFTRRSSISGLMANMDLVEILNAFGTSVFAITGAIAAAKKDMDIFGIMLVAFLVGNGGGTIRDLLLNKDVFWVHQPMIMVVTIIPALLAVILFHFVQPPKRILLYADAIGLGVFTVIGAQVALQFGCHPVNASIMGMITGVGGGILRDLLCNQIPLIMRSQIYASSAFLGAFSFLILSKFIPINIAIYIGISVTIATRLAGIHYKLNLPKFKILEKD